MAPGRQTVRRFEAILGDCGWLCARADGIFPGLTQIPWRQNVTDIADCDLASIYPKPSERVLAKARPALDAHSKKFIEMSPFCVLATSGSDGSVDASPRGGTPGFVHVAGANSLLMPDRSGNNRIDSFRNIVEGSGFAHLLFFVPGIDETLRVGGRGTRRPKAHMRAHPRRAAGCVSSRGVEDHHPPRRQRGRARPHLQL
jgi:predicted pyridoxine 5'-phosphate oxidase superfamily flavin-nucleotide-binding protein